MCLIIPGIGLYIRRSKALTIASFVFVCSFFLPFLYMFFFLPHCRYTYSFSTNVSRQFFFFAAATTTLSLFHTCNMCQCCCHMCHTVMCVFSDRNSCKSIFKLNDSVDFNCNTMCTFGKFCLFKLIIRKIPHYG